MALNKFMHPRNPYKDRKPNFGELSEKYEEFREQTTIDDHGHYHIDFKKPECLRALSWALLKEDFGLNVLMPLDRLIPTVPLRLNYILWLEDILVHQTRDVCGIDIGTGSSCIYSMIGAKKNNWQFLATETDVTNYSYAKKNVESNQLTDQIKVVQVADSSTLYDVLSDSDTAYDFCMCNPPFFGSNFEAWGMLTSRSSERPEPSSVCTASPVESIVPGGEVEFVKRMINDSLTLRGRIRVYTTMLGKKSSLPILKEELKRNQVTNLSQTEFCQGKTMRWGLGWSFDDSIIFPKSHVKVVKAEKPKPPLVYHIPQQGCVHGSNYSLEGVTEKLLTFLRDLEIAVTDKKKIKKTHSFTITASENTWSNQRKKRRQQQNTTATTKQQQVVDQTNSQDPTEGNINQTDEQKSCIDCTRASEKSEYKDLSEKGQKRKCSNLQIDPQETDSKKLKSDDEEVEIDKSTLVCGDVNGENSGDQAGDMTCKHYTESKTNESDLNKSAFPQDIVVRLPSEPEEPILCCKINICAKAENDIIMTMAWVNGEKKEAMHQVLQYLKNRLQ